MEGNNDAGAKTGVCCDNGEQETLPSLSFVGSLQYPVQLPLNTSNAINVRELRGLFEKKRQPLFPPRKTPSHREKAIILQRKKHSRWGGEKIWNLLHKTFEQEEIPCISTGNRIIKRNGLLVVHKGRPGIKPVYPVFTPQACNEVWRADFKGRFRIGNQNTVIP